MQKKCIIHCNMELPFSFVWSGSFCVWLFCIKNICSFVSGSWDLQERMSLKYTQHLWCWWWTVWHIFYLSKYPTHWDVFQLFVQPSLYLHTLLSPLQVLRAVSLWTSRMIQLSFFCDIHGQSLIWCALFGAVSHVCPWSTASAQSLGVHHCIQNCRVPLVHVKTPPHPPAATTTTLEQKSVRPVPLK